MTWNTLDVPLRSGWKCTLIPARQYRDTMWRAYHDMSARALYPNAGRRWRPWNEPEPNEYEQRRLWEEDAKKQLVDDHRDFARYFRPEWDLRTITGGNALDAIQTFLRDALNVAHWNYPTDNESIQRMLCDAVASKKLIPVINREYRGVSRVTQPSPAPQSWASTGGGGSYWSTPKVYTMAEFQALQRANGELPALADSAGPGAALNPLPTLGAPARADDDFGMPGVVESVTGAFPESDDDDSGLGFATDDSDGSPPLSDARPFEYTPDSVANDVEQDAGVFLTPAEEAECEMQLNADMDECSAWYAAKPSSWGMCRERAMQRYANCLGGKSID